MLATGGLLAATGLAGLGPTAANASSHREAPLISGAPQYDNTDVYAFVSPDAPDTGTRRLPSRRPTGLPSSKAAGAQAQSPRQ